MATGFTAPPQPGESLRPETQLTGEDGLFQRGRMSISAYYGLSGSMICLFLGDKITEPRVIGISKSSF